MSGINFTGLFYQCSVKNYYKNLAVYEYYTGAAGKKVAKMYSIAF